MMGRHHAILAAAVGLLVADAAGMRPAAALAFAASVGGAGMLPDIDEPGSSVAHAAEPLSTIVSAATNRLAGGHRLATHSALAVVGVGLATWAFGMVTLARNWPASVVILAITLALGMRGVMPIGWRLGKLNALVVGAVAAAATARYVGMSWLPVAVSMGWALHIAGDMLTSGGVPLLWPCKVRIAWPILDHTGSARETTAAIVLGVLLVLLAYGPATSVLGGRG